MATFVFCRPENFPESGLAHLVRATQVCSPSRRNGFLILGQEIPGIKTPIRITGERLR